MARSRHYSEWGVSPPDWPWQRVVGHIPLQVLEAIRPAPDRGSDRSPQNERTRAMLDWSEFNVAEAKSADIGSVLALRDEAAQWLLSAGIDQWQPGEWPYAWDHAPYDVYLLRHGAELAGTVTLLWEDQRIWGDEPVPAGYIHNLVVARAYGGHGLGRRLLQWAEDHVVASGRTVVRLDCVKGNRKLRDLYESVGFHWVRDKPFPQLGSDQGVALYEKLVRGDSPEARSPHA